MGVSKEAFIMETQVWKLLILVARLEIVLSANHEHNYEYSPYHFEYKVDDDKEYLHFGQEEEDDGAGNVHGYYHVQLPDGRLQRVDYHVSGYSGYIADVQYDGEAHHPSKTHHTGYDHYGGHQSVGVIGGLGRFGKAISVSPTKVEPRTFVQKAQELRGDSVRQGKAESFKSKPLQTTSTKSKARGLITRTRIDDPGKFTTSSSELVKSFRKPEAIVARPVEIVNQRHTTQPLFEFRDSRNRLQTFKEAHDETANLRKSQQVIGNFEHNTKNIQDIEKAKQHIDTVQRITHETQGLVHAQKRLQNLQQVQTQFVKLENDEKIIRKNQQSTLDQPSRRQEHRRFPSVIKHELFEPNFSKISTDKKDERLSAKAVGDFSTRFVGRVIQVP